MHIIGTAAETRSLRTIGAAPNCAGNPAYLTGVSSLYLTILLCPSYGLSLAAATPPSHRPYLVKVQNSG